MPQMRWRDAGRFILDATDGPRLVTRWVAGKPEQRLRMATTTRIRLRVFQPVTTESNVTLLAFELSEVTKCGFSLFLVTESSPMTATTRLVVLGGLPDGYRRHPGARLEALRSASKQLARRDLTRE